MATAKEQIKRGDAHVKLLVASAAAGRIIGRSGDELKNLISQFGVFVQLSRTMSLFPEVGERILLASGSCDALLQFIETLIDKVYLRREIQAEVRMNEFPFVCNDSSPVKTIIPISPFCILTGHIVFRILIPIDEASNEFLQSLMIRKQLCNIGISVHEYRPSSEILITLIGAHTDVKPIVIMIVHLVSKKCANLMHFNYPLSLEGTVAPEVVSAISRPAVKMFSKQGIIPMTGPITSKFKSAKSFEITEDASSFNLTSEKCIKNTDSKPEWNPKQPPTYYEEQHSTISLNLIARNSASVNTSSQNKLCFANYNQSTRAQGISKNNTEDSRFTQTSSEISSETLLDFKYKINNICNSRSPINSFHHSPMSEFDALVDKQQCQASTTLDKMLSINEKLVFPSQQNCSYVSLTPAVQSNLTSFPNFPYGQSYNQQHDSFSSKLQLNIPHNHKSEKNSNNTQAIVLTEALLPPPYSDEL